MATTKLKAADVKNLSTDSLVSIRNQSQATLGSAPKGSAEYKIAQANLNKVNSEINKDLKIGGTAAKTLTSDQILSVSNARTNFASSVDLGGAPENIQKKVNSSLTKNISAAEKLSDQTLKKIQTSEIRVLKNSGADSSVINAAKSENKAEGLELKGLLSQPGYQNINSIVRSDGTRFVNDNNQIITSGASYAGTPAGERTAQVLNEGLGLLSYYNLPQASKEGKATTGFTVDRAGLLALDNPNYRDPSFTGQFTAAENLRSNQFSGRDINHIIKGFTAFGTDKINPTLSDKAKVITSGFDAEGRPIEIIQDIAVGYEKGNTVQYFTRDADGNLTQVGGDKSFTPTGGGGFFSSIAGKLLIGAVGGFLLGPTAGLLATGSTAGAATLGSTIAAGSLLGATGSAITGDNILTGALLGGLGGAGMFKVGQAGGLGNVAKNLGVNLSDDVRNTLNTLVSGVGTPTQQNAQTAANILNANGVATSADDIITSVAREGVEAGFPAGSNVVGSPINAGVGTGGGFRLTPNMVEDFIPTPSFGGATVPRPVPGSTGGIGFNPNAGGIGFQVNPEDFFPTPEVLIRTGGQIPNYVNANVDRYLGTTPSFLDQLRDYAETAGSAAYEFIKENPLAALGIAGAASNALNPPEIEEIKPPELAPDINFNPGQFPGGGGAGGPIDFNAFMNLYRRGGLGAGQYLGYDLARLLGDIPAQTLLGTPTLGGMIGQAAASQTSLV